MRSSSRARSSRLGARPKLIALSVQLLALVSLLTAAACGSSKKSSSSGGATAVTISNEQGTTWTCGVNPFNASVNFLSFGTEYEELTYVDGLKSGATTPPRVVASCPTPRWPGRRRPAARRGPGT